MKTISQLLEIIENRVRNYAKMKAASRDIDQIRKRAPAGWNSVEVIRQMRQGRL
jgi:hypothetical protein